MIRADTVGFRILTSGAGVYRQGGGGRAVLVTASLPKTKTDGSIGRRRFGKGTPGKPVLPADHAVRETRRPSRLVAGTS
jgi:hypothetical protein